jgi:hypothetical protein
MASRLNSILPDLKADGYKRRVYLGVFTPAVVLQATVSTTPVDGALNLAISVVSGSAADVFNGFMVRVFTAGGSLKGTTNVRAYGTISSANLPIHELGYADIPIVATDVVKVYNIGYLGDKLPAADQTFAPDYLPYVNQGSVIIPRVCSGGHFLGFVDHIGTTTQTAYATIPMPGVSSAEDPDSGGGLTHLWVIMTSGTVTFAPGSASSDANPTFRCTAGYGFVRHNVTDNGNSALWQQFVSMQVYDLSANLPYRILDASLNGTEAGGWNADSVEVYNNATLSALPDGSLCGLFSWETINGVTISYGNVYSGRSQIKLIGYLYRDEQNLQSSIRRLRFSIRGVLAQLASLPGFSKVFIRGASDWTDLDGLTVRLVMWQILSRYSFFTELFDFVIDASILNKLYPAYYLQTKSALEQLREVADGIDARITNTRTGELLVHTRPELVPLGSRSGITTTLTLATWMWRAATLNRDHWKTVELYEARGFTASATTPAPILSRFPGLTPGRGAQMPIVERQICDSQADLNARCGRRAARIDGSFFDANGVYARAVEWSGDLVNALDVFDFYPEYCATSFDATSNLRAIDLSAYLYYLSSIDVTYHAGGTADVHPSFLMATNAPSGATYVPPTVESTPLPPVAFPPPPNTLPGWNGALKQGIGKIAAVTSGNYLVRTTDFSTPSAAGGPTWQSIDLTQAPYSLVGSTLDWVPDAFSPKYLGTGTAVNGWILTTTRIYRITDIFGTVGLTSQHSFSACDGGEIQTERATQNNVIAHVLRSGVSTVYYTTNGSTWASASGVPVASGNTLSEPGLFMSPHGGLARTLFYASANVSAGYTSTDGSAWSSAASPNFALGNNLGVWLTEAFQIQGTYYAYQAASGGLIRITGAAQTDVSPTYSATPYPANGGGIRGMRIDDNHANFAACLARTLTTNTDTGLWLAYNGITSPSSWTNVIAPSNSNYGVLANLSIVYPALYAYGNAHIEYMTLNGFTRDDRSGNLGAVGGLINLCGS